MHIYKKWWQNQWMIKSGSRTLLLGSCIHYLTNKVTVSPSLFLSSIPNISFCAVSYLSLTVWPGMASSSSRNLCTEFPLGSMQVLRKDSLYSEMIWLVLVEGHGYYPCLSTALNAFVLSPLLENPCLLLKASQSVFGNPEEFFHSISNILIYSFCLVSILFLSLCPSSISQAPTTHQTV